MKRITILTAVIFAALSFTSCAPSTESSGWLNGTTWKADLAGKQYTGSIGSWSHVAIITEGFIKIHFSILGYKLTYEYGGDSATGEGSIVSRLSPDYNYPELLFPIVVGGDKDNPDIEYCEGIISDDFKTIHFDTFNTGAFVFTNIDFTR